MAARLMGYVSASNTPTVVGATQGYGVATGGTSSSPNISGQDYTVLTFSSDDNLVVSSAGLFDVLLVSGGGGAGAGTSGRASSGGGGGGVIGLTTLTTIFLEAAT